MFYPRVAWVQDWSTTGGAELSNLEVIRVGRLLGFSIQQITPKNFDLKWLRSADLIVINNFFQFKDDQAKKVLELIFEKNVPYVKYEHDHREIERLGLSRRLFGKSRLNVFISPLQEKGHRKVIEVDPCIVLPLAYDTHRFCNGGEDVRKKNTVVSTTGKLWNSKGLMNIYAFVMNRPDLIFDVYSIKNDIISQLLGNKKNVRLHEPIPIEQMPNVYRQAEYVIHLPTYPEACGRSVVEGVLCGCKPVVNELCGVASYDWWGDRKKLVDAVKKAPYKFWKAIDSIERWKSCT
ncbi:MAG: hypothetical protein AB1401_00485 [Thermodesulfobacteriota bacterium]